MLRVVKETARDEGDGRSVLDEIAREGARRERGTPNHRQSCAIETSLPSARMAL